MSFGEAIILAIIQGLTEFLPVSSSGHLVLGRALLGDGLPHSIAFEVVVHLGTFLAVIIVFFVDIRKYLTVLVRHLGSPAAMLHSASEDRDLRFALLMLVGMLPAGILGLLAHDAISNSFQSPLLVTATLTVTGILLLATRFSSPGQRPLEIGGAILIGLAQAAALLPGISRSGATISTALYLGISQQEAARFSFLMVLPLIAAATGLELAELAGTGVNSHEWGVLLTGLLVSFFTGWLSLRWLLGLLKGGKFHTFAWYCFAVAISAFIYFR